MTGRAGRSSSRRTGGGGRQRPVRADDGIRTRDPHLGKVMRYQLRYVRTTTTEPAAGCLPRILADVTHLGLRGVDVVGDEAVHFGHLRAGQPPLPQWTYPGHYVRR